jgi:hypothetical protein
MERVAVAGGRCEGAVVDRRLKLRARTVLSSADPFQTAPARASTSCRAGRRRSRPLPRRRLDRPGGGSCASLGLRRARIALTLVARCPSPSNRTATSGESGRG